MVLDQPSQEALNAAEHPFPTRDVGATLMKAHDTKLGLERSVHLRPLLKQLSQIAPGGFDYAVELAKFYDCEWTMRDAYDS